jgi:hypothetical protein
VIIDEQKWNDIIAATRAGIDRWNARAVKHHCRDTFYCRVLQTQGHAVVLTEQAADWYESAGPYSAVDSHALARELSSGELRLAQPMGEEGRPDRFHIASVLTWRQQLAGKSGDEIVQQLKLLDFLMFTRAGAERMAVH